MIKFLDIKCVVNDNLGVCTRIRYKIDHKTALEKLIIDRFRGHNLIKGSIYYYESKMINLKSEKNPFYFDDGSKNEQNVRNLVSKIKLIDGIK